MATSMLTQKEHAKKSIKAEVVLRARKTKPASSHRTLFSLDYLIGDGLKGDEPIVKVIGLVRKGIEPQVIERLGIAGLEPKYQVKIITPRTYQRRCKAGERLTPEEGERALRYARIMAEADRVFGDHEKALRWLQFPMQRLESQSPLDVLDTDLGARLVEDMLGQIDEGYFA